MGDRICKKMSYKARVLTVWPVHQCSGESWVCADQLPDPYIFQRMYVRTCTIQAYFIGMATTFLPIYAVGYIVSFLWNRPAEALTKKICNE